MGYNLPCVQWKAVGEMKKPHLEECKHCGEVIALKENKRTGGYHYYNYYGNKLPHWWTCPVIQNMRE